MNVSNHSLFENISLVESGRIAMAQDNQAERIGKIVVCSVMMIAALLGNILVIIVVCRNANMRKTINYFIVNMSISDLAIPLFVLPRVISENVTSNGAHLWRIHGTAGLALCKVVFFISDLSPIVSIFSLVCITVDRFCAVVFPMRRTLMTSRVRLGLIIFTWVFAAAFCSPHFYTKQLISFPSREGLFCLLRWSTVREEHIAIQSAYFTASSILFVIIPMILLTAMYATIMGVVKLSFLSRQGQQGSAAQKRQQVNNARLLRLAVLTVASFAICWGPYNIYLLVQSFVFNWMKPLSVFSDVAVYLTYAHSMINPCLYFLFIENYRRGLKRVLTSVSAYESKVTLQSRLLDANSMRASSRRRHVITNSQELEEKGALASNELLVMHPLVKRQSVA